VPEADVSEVEVVVVDVPAVEVPEVEDPEVEDPEVEVSKVEVVEAPLSEVEVPEACVPDAVGETDEVVPVLEEGLELPPPQAIRTVLMPIPATAFAIFFSCTGIQFLQDNSFF
jgi:hypothetical protein